MKKQIILTIFTGILMAFIIYKITYHEEMNFLALGDGISLGLTAYNVKGYSYNDYLKDYFEDNTILREYISDFASVDETSKSLLNKISNNEVASNNMTIQQAISKAKIITISLGMDELNNLKTLKSKNISEYLTNMEKIIKMIRNINKNNQVIITSLYETFKLSKDNVLKINNELNNLANKYNLKFVDISDVVLHKEFYMMPYNYYLNYKGHEYISELVKKVI